MNLKEDISNLLEYDIPLMDVSISLICRKVSRFIFIKTRSPNLLPGIARMLPEARLCVAVYFLAGVALSLLGAATAQGSILIFGGVAALLAVGLCEHLVWRGGAVLTMAPSKPNMSGVCWQLALAASRLSVWSIVAFSFLGYVACSLECYWRYGLVRPANGCIAWRLYMDQPGRQWLQWCKPTVP